jgi:hypothetical protein
MMGADETGEVKVSQPIEVICRSYELTFEEFDRIPQLAGEAMPQLSGWLAAQGIAAAGPNIFEYRFHDSPHGPRRIRGGRFTLTIAVPVHTDLTPPDPISRVELSAFKHIEIVTDRFGDEWRRVRDLAEHQGFERSLVEREVYHAWHGVGDPQTRVALQVGIKCAFSDTA